MWQEEKQTKQQQIEKLQEMTKKYDENIQIMSERIKELESEIETRDECEEKV